MGLNCLHQLRSNIEDRGERGERILEDHANAIATDLGHLLVAEAEQFAAVKLYGPGDLRVVRQEPHDGHGGHGLTRTGFAHDTKRAARVEIKIHATDRGDGSGFGWEVYAQVFDG